jgi:hypothetical protein
MITFRFQRFISLISAVLLLSAGCSMEDFEEFKQLGGLRIVGVEVDNSEIDGTTSGTVNVTLTPYISDIDAGGRTFSVSVVSCLDATFAQTGQLGCKPNTETYPNSNSFDTSTLSASSYTGAMDSITISINDPASLIENFSEQLRFNGVPYYVFFTLSSGSESLSFVKQLRITDRGTLNSNPEIDEVRLDGSELTSAPSGSGTLSVTLTASGEPEKYAELTGNGTTQSQTESYLVSWFASPGDITLGRVLFGQTSELDTNQSTVLIAVVRDRRGGTDVVVLSP